MKFSFGYFVSILFLFFIGLFSCVSQSNSLKDNFGDPPNGYRPMPFWHLNGELTKESISKQIENAHKLSGFGGVTVLPVSEGGQFNTGILCPGTEPKFLSDEYFDRYLDMLETSQSIGTELILYDDLDFPSGSGGGKLIEQHPELSRKFLVKDEFVVKGGTQIVKEYALDPTSSFIAVSALNLSTKEVLDLSSHYNNSVLDWSAPEGEWRIMFFSCRYDVNGAYGKLVDYMDPVAVSKVMDMTFGEYDRHFNRFFGNVIKKTFFDDVGFVHQEETWTPAITKIFEEKYKKNPALYYPALYYDIGAETQSARIAFFDIRSELMAEGYVKQVSDWSEKRNLQSMGHPPENYSPNSVVANGDILKYYRHAHIPLLDAIFFYGRGLHGFKQISSAADVGDKPVVGAELCGAFPADMDSLTLYRVAMEAMARGVNFVVPHGMWYDTDPAKVRIPPLISNENSLLRDCLPNYSTYIARSCMMLQGGKRVSDIALLWPIASIQGETYINRDATSGLPVANWLPENVNHHQISNILTNQIHRDFTFVHPEDLCNGKITAQGSELLLNNIENTQRFKVLIMPGGKVISLSTLKVIKKYYDNGGSVIATASLPFLSSEFGKDEEVQSIISEMFGENEKGIIPEEDIFRSNDKGGKLAFIRQTDRNTLSRTLSTMELVPDVNFENLSSTNKIGYINYIHKQKENKEIYFFTNSTDDSLSTQVTLRGEIKNIEIWNPHTGEMKKITAAKNNDFDGDSFMATIDITLPAVSSLFIIGITK